MVKQWGTDHSFSLSSTYKQKRNPDNISQAWEAFSLNTFVYTINDLRTEGGGSKSESRLRQTCLYWSICVCLCEGKPMMSSCPAFHLASYQYCLTITPLCPAYILSFQMYVVYFGSIYKTKSSCKDQRDSAS